MVYRALLQLPLHSPPPPSLQRSPLCSLPVWMSLSPYMIGVAEAWWSPQAATSGVTPDDARAHVQRCRMLARGIQSHPIFGSPYEAVFCAREAEAVLPPWELEA